VVPNLEDLGLPPLFRALRSRSIYQGKIVGLKLDRVLEPGGITTTREVVSHPGSVVVLPRLADGSVLLVRQFRYAIGRSLWELVAGAIDPGESVRAAALRELTEETGYSARSLRPLLRFYPSPWFLTERMHLIEATGLTFSKAQPEPDERIRVGRFGLAELRKMLRTGKIVDGKTLIGLQWLLNSV